MMNEQYLYICQPYRKNNHLLREREEESDKHVFHCLFSTQVDLIPFIDNLTIAFR